MTPHCIFFFEKSVMILKRKMYYDVPIMYKYSRAIVDLSQINFFF